MVQNIVNTCYQIAAITENHSVDSLRASFLNHFTHDFFDKMKSDLISDREAFVELYNMFDIAQSKLFSLADCHGDQGFRSFIYSLMTDGVVKVEGLLPNDLVDCGNLVLQ